MIFLNSNANNFSAVKLLPFNVYSSFEHLHGHKQGSGYALQWKFTNKAVVDHYEIVSTNEDPLDIYSNWYTVGTVNHRNGVIKYVDYAVLPCVIRNRIKAVFANGNPNELSDVYIARIE
jgi:hypothetical protein